MKINLGLIVTILLGLSTANAGIMENAFQDIAVALNERGEYYGVTSTDDKKARSCSVRIGQNIEGYHFIATMKSWSEGLNGQKTDREHFEVLISDLDKGRTAVKLEDRKITISSQVFPQIFPGGKAIIEINLREGATLEPENIVSVRVSEAGIGAKETCYLSLH